ncbi:MAG: DNA cytosine methyltransferase [Bradyrhizobium sp.]|uniref:DNA cytosine methyltransferase n=1 Tax=Bradyrhizobium sp. TaxID=376 RepID=UPI003D143C4D
MADPVNILSLYSGSGMHDEAVCAALRVLGFDPRVLGYVEREASAAAWLLARMEAAAVEPAPVWCGDLADLDARPLRGWVDLVVASPPCQPYSSAGKRLGNADERSHGDGDGPLPHTVRIIGECRPAVVQFENVSEWVTGGHFREFGEELCGMGYDIAPPLFLAAADVGAPHERERVFIHCRLAHAKRCLWESRPERVGVCGAGGQLAVPSGDHGRKRRGREEPRGSTGVLGNSMAHSERGRRLSRQPDDDARQSDAEGIGLDMGHAERADARAGEAGEQGGAGIGRRGHADAGDELADSVRERRSDPRDAGELGSETDSAEREPEARRLTTETDGRGPAIPLFPPGRNDYGRWAALVAGGLDPACMPAVERGLSALADGLGFSNSELLRLGGNGVVPSQAALAFTVLSRGYLWDVKELTPESELVEPVGRRLNVQRELH